MFRPLENLVRKILSPRVPACESKLLTRQIFFAVISTAFLCQGSITAAQDQAAQPEKVRRPRLPGIAEVGIAEREESAFAYSDSRYRDYRNHDAAFFKMLRTHPKSYARLTCVLNLAKDLPADDDYYALAVASLRTSLKDSSDAVAEQAAKYLRDCNAPPKVLATALPELVANFSHRDDDVALPNLEVVAKIGPLAESVLGDLIKVTESNNSLRGMFACRAIAGIGARSAIPMLIELAESDRPEQLLAGAYEALGSFDREDVLVRGLNSGVSSRRVAAALGATQLASHTPDLVSRLRQMVKEHDSTYLCRAACQGLAAVRPITSENEKLIAEALTDPDITHVARDIALRFEARSELVRDAMIRELRKPGIPYPKSFAFALSEFPLGQEEAFQYLKRSVSEDYGWPDQEAFFRNMAGTFLTISQDIKRSGIDRAIALKGIKEAHDKKVLTPQQEKSRTDFAATVFDKDNPLEVRLSALMNSEIDFYDLAEIQGSSEALRWLLRRGLDECKLTFLRRACLQKILWRWRKEEESELKIGADKLVEIAQNPYDPLCGESMIFLKDLPKLATNMVPGLVKNFEKYDDSEQEYAIEAMGNIATHPELTLPVIQKRFQSGENQSDCVVAMAQIIGANDLDAKPAIDALTQLLSNEDWEPYTSVNNFCKALGPKAAPAASALVDYLERQKEPDNYLVTRISKALALMGPDARESALAVTGYLKFAYEHYVGQVLLDLTRAGLGKDLVPFALRHIDEENNQQEIMEALTVAGPDADECVPKLVELLDDKAAQHEAAKTLAYMGKRARVAGDKLKALARRGDENAGFALLCLFPEDESTVQLGLKALGSIWPQQGEKLEAILGPDVVKLKKTISATLDGNARNGLLTQAERAANAKDSAATRPTVKILKATYGNTKKKTDVTNIVQRLFDDDAAAIRPNAQGLGIENPAPKGKGKKLSIKYSVNEKEFDKKFGNPKREIRLSKVLLVGPGGNSLVKLAPLAEPAESTAAVPFSPTVHGEVSVRKLSDTTFRLEPFGVIGIPAAGFAWKMSSDNPPTFECRKEAGDTWMTISVLPPMIDFEYARSKSLEDRAEGVIEELTARGATINAQRIGSYGDGRWPGARGAFFGYSINDIAYQYIGIRLFRRDSSFVIEVSAPNDSLTHSAMMGAAGFFELDVDAATKKRTRVPADVKEAITKEIAKLLPIMDMKTATDVEKMIEYTMSKQQLDRMKASGEFNKAAAFCLKDTGPRILFALQSIDWHRAEFRDSGKRVFFPVPPRGLTFFKTDGQWKMSLR